MNNMFKKTLVAAALASLSTSAFAATLQATDATGVITGPTFPVNVSTEYLALAADDEYESGDLVVELGGEYAVGDTVEISANIAPEQFPANATVAQDTGAELKGITFGLLNVSTDGLTATYRVTEVSGGASDLTTGQTVNFGTFVFAASDVSEAGGADVTYTAWAGPISANTPLDRGGDNAAVLINVASQLAYGADPVFDQVISVEAERVEFVEAATDATDTLTLTVEADETFANAADIDSVDYTVSGNFSWVDPAAAAAVFDVTCGGAGVLSDDEYTASAITFTCDSGDGATVIINTSGNTDYGSADAAVLIAGNFTATADVNYSVAAEEATATISGSAGRWTLDGSSVFVPYMPFNANISQVLLVTNDGSQDGVVSVEAYDEAGEVYGPFNVGTSEAGTTKNITAAVRSGLIADGANLSGDTIRLALRITTNVPDGDVTVYSAYNVGGTGARLVVNDSNGKSSDD